MLTVNFQAMAPSNITNDGSTLAAWKLTVNILCLDYGGNMLDAALIATITALKSTTLPSITYDTDTKLYEIIESNEDQMGTKLELEHDVTCCSFAFVGNRLIPDPTIEEEDISNGMVHIAIDAADGSLVYLHTSFGKAVDEKDLSQAITQARLRSKEIIHLINEAVKKLK